MHIVLVSHASPIEVLWCGVNATEIDGFDNSRKASYRNGSIGVDLLYYKRAFFDWVEFSFYIVVQYKNVLTWLIVVLDPLLVVSCIVIKNVPVFIVRCKSPIGEISGIEYHVSSKSKFSRCCLQRRMVC